MQIYTTRPEPVRMAQWNGAQDEAVVQELRDLGFHVCFQVSPFDTEMDWDEATNAEVEVPAQGRLVVSGKYNWDTWHFSPGCFITFRLVDKVTGVSVEWTDENLADPANKIYLGERTKSSIDENYDLVG